MTKFYFPPEPIHVRELPAMPRDVLLATPEQNFGCHGIAREINALYADTPSDDVMWQPDVYTEARLLADRYGIKRIVDVGCGNGEKLIHNFPADQFQTVGLDFHGSLELVTNAFPHARWVECDLNSTADLAQFFGELSPDEPVLMILSDVIEHIPDPRLLLAQLRTVLLQNVANRLVLSTPDRVLLDYKSYGAAPDNLAHVREWTHEELAVFCTAAGFQIERCGHTRANQFDAKYSTIYVELRCEPAQYMSFLKEQGLLHDDVLPTHLLVTDEYIGLSNSGDSGFFVAAQRQVYGYRNALCLFIGRPDNLDPEYFARHQLIAPQLLVDEHDMPLPIEDVALKATLQLLFYFPNLREIAYVDYRGHGCRLAQAKRAGLFPQWVEVVAHCQGATHFLENANQTWFGDSHLCVAEREKIAIENADTVVFPTPFLRDFYRESGIEVDDAKVVYLRNPYPAEPAEIGQTELADTLVFYGHRSAMSGYGMFLDALALGVEPLRELGIRRIVVIGPSAGESAEDIARMDDLRARFSVAELAWLGHTIAIEQLRGYARRAICVMPYQADNHPYALLEASFAGILPLMVRSGGVSALYPEPFDRVLLAEPADASLLSSIAALVKMPVEERQRLRVNFLKSMVLAQEEINKAFQQFGERAAHVQAVKRAHGRASVIVPVYNTDLKFISDLVFGLNNQSMSPTEVIFVDDGSTLGYAGQLDELLQRELNLPYRLIIHPENRGLTSARNTALNAVDTEYVINLDSDDIPLNDFVRNIVRRLDAEPRCDAAVPFLKAFNEETNFNEFALNRHTFRPLGDGVALSMITNYLGHANSGYRTSVLRALGGWDETKRSMWEDWALFLRLTSSGHRIGIIPQADCLYRVRKQSMLRTYKEWPAMRRLASNMAGIPLFDSFRLQALMRHSRAELARLREEVSASAPELTRLREEVSAAGAELTHLREEVNSLEEERISLRARTSMMESELSRICAENAALTAELNRASVRAVCGIVARLKRFPYLYEVAHAVGKGVWKIGRSIRNLVTSK